MAKAPEALVVRAKESPVAQPGGHGLERTRAPFGAGANPGGVEIFVQPPRAIGLKGCVGYEVAC